MRTIKVAKTDIEGVAIISTVMLEHEHLYVHPYETMIFSDDEKFEDYQVRTTTREEALLAHIDAIAFVIKGE